MTDKIADHLLNKMTKGAFTVKGTLAALLSISVLTQPANAADQEWWFDVEVILFARDLDAADISEKFKQSSLEQPKRDILDLVTPYLNPDLSYLRAGLPYCRASNRLAVQTQYEQDFAFPLPEVETDGSSSLHPMEGQGQEDLIQVQPIEQGLAVNSDQIPEETFENEVATTDIFPGSNDTTYLTQPTDGQDATSSNFENAANSEQINSDNVDPEANIELTAEMNLARPPIQVEFMEWQIPREFLCAYAEQIDPSFSSITPLQHHEPSNQIKRVPEIINGTEWQQKRGAFLLPTSTMHMSDLYDKIKRQRDITPILHLSWRQEVKFGRDKSQTFRLFAGENFAEKFDANGLPLVDDTDTLFDNLNQSIDEFYIPEQELALLTPERREALLVGINNTGAGAEAIADDLFTRIDAALADDTPVNIDQTDSQIEKQITSIDPVILKEIWQLDGGITVYLRNLGRVPYLHIDSNLDFRQPMFDPNKAPQIEYLSDDLSDRGVVAVNQLQQSSSQKQNYLPNYLQNYLQSVNFNQLRRVISKQVHYFDHPLFGMVVRINRYRWPEIPSEDVEAVSQEN